MVNFVCMEQPKRDDSVSVVEEGAEDADGGESENRRRELTVKVKESFVAYVAGVRGGCHHICMLFRLVRLLRMTAYDLSACDMTAVTSRQCQWRLNHCCSRRGTEDNMWLE